MKRPTKHLFTEREKYLAGPRTMKDPTSEEWIVQTLYALRIYWESLERYHIEFEKVKAELESQRVWERYPPGRPYGSEDELFKNELKASSEQVDAAVLRANGERGLGMKNPDRKSYGNAIVKPGTHRTYIKARLKRDDKTDLLAQVNAGNLSAHAAAIEAGWRKRMIQCEPTIEGFIKAITRHLSESEREELKGRI